MTRTPLSRSIGQRSICRGGDYCGGLPDSLLVLRSQLLQRKHRVGLLWSKTIRRRFTVFNGPRDLKSWLFCAKIGMLVPSGRENISSMFEVCKNFFSTYYLKAERCREMDKVVRDRPHHKGRPYRFYQCTGWYCLFQTSYNALLKTRKFSDVLKRYCCFFPDNLIRIGITSAGLAASLVLWPCCLGRHSGSLLRRCCCWVWHVVGTSAWELSFGDSAASLFVPVFSPCHHIDYGRNNQASARKCLA